MPYTSAGHIAHEISPAQALEIARRRFCRISADGILLARRGAPYQEIIVEQVNRAMEFLATLTPTKSARACSYQLKHAAESWAGAYISNGALIVAAIALGLKVRSAGRDFESNPNALIGVRA
ncbi:hypothetical protein UP09_14265 [Bradyrhizobium sp. LTSP885]|uniref:hypothetical protein n=1 Tax=Bradyrhizobium sp. LTSP885 TaxID=1619232 RepID=UPI0005CB18B2|nr:hypothetical protein [Bradyrhizobium sp. LTSP885]KJC44812.1 hypothetical protein UP09_14265 [Bradyrhizobium sp. LTSP885]